MRLNVSYIFPPCFYMSCILYAESSKILYILPMGCKSTSGFHHAISKILIDGGHTILAINSYPLKNTPNYIDISKHINFTLLSDSYGLDDEFIGTYTNVKLTFEDINCDCERIYADKIISKFIKSEKIDLILLEIDATYCYLPFAAQTGAPIIGVSANQLMFAEFEGLMGNPVNPSYIPVIMSGFSTRMDFFQKLSNTKDFILHWLMNFYFTRKANIMVAKYMDSPPIEQLYEKISLVFYNGHFSMIPKPNGPNTIDIAGVHISRNRSPLPQDIREFMDGADRGVIYFSLGSVVKISSFPSQIHDMLVNVFKKLPYRIIWRHDNPNMVANLSENILARYWLPQIDILAHQKVILFVSHSGILSTYEAIHFAVPLLTLPYFYDQFTNAAVIQDLRIGLTLDLRNLDESSLLTGINEVIYNKTYRENMKKVSKIFADRPKTPEESVMFWTEYVLRNSNASFLKPTGSKLPFYQYLLLDVVLFLLLISFSVVWVIQVLLKLAYPDVKKIIKKIKSN